MYKMESALFLFVVVGIVMGCADALTARKDVTALKLLREEVRGRDSYWNGVIESWVGDDPCGDDWEGNWEGVECRFQGDLDKDIPRKVTNLHLPDRKLGGPVPLAISLLREIIELDMDGNRLSGPMNPYLGCLSNMREFDLANNTLTGTIPTEWRFLTKLEEAEIEANPGLYGCLPQGMPPTTTVCYDESEIIGTGRPICELIGTIVTDTGVQGFCPDIPNIEKRCPDEAFVQEFIDEGRPYELYFRSQADSSLPGQIPVDTASREIPVPQPVQPVAQAPTFAPGPLVVDPVSAPVYAPTYGPGVQYIYVG